PVPPVFDRGGADSAQRRLGLRSCVSFRYACRLKVVRLVTPSPSAIASRNPNSAGPAHRATTGNVTIPIVRAPPPSEPVPRFPPLRFVGPLPPEPVASSFRRQVSDNP